MNESTKPLSFELHKGAVLDLACARGTVVSCDMGHLWVTRMGSAEDFVLAPGARFLVTERGTVNVHALQPSLARVQHPRNIPRGLSPEPEAVGSVKVALELAT